MSPYRRAKAIAKPPTAGKDIWDKISTLTPSFVTLVLGLLGAYATYSYNQRNLEQQNQQAIAAAQAKKDQADRDYAQQTQQARNAQLLANAQQLEKLFPYMASSDPQSRTFGYAMFAALGEEKLALELMKLKNDKAGISVARALQQSDSSSVRAAAAESLATLLTTEQRQVIADRLTKQEYSGSYSLLVGAGEDVLYGRGGWQVAGGSLSRLLAFYCDDAGRQVPELCAAPIRRPVSNAQRLLLKNASSDPAMQRAQDKLLAQEISAPLSYAEQMARLYGLKSPLSIAVIADTATNIGTGRTKDFAERVAAQIGATANGDDFEKNWTIAFLKERRRYIETRSGSPDMKRGLLRRVEDYERLIADGDWDMKTEAAKAAEKKVN